MSQIPVIPLPNRPTRACYSILGCCGALFICLSVALLLNLNGLLVDLKHVALSSSTITALPLPHQTEGRVSRLTPRLFSEFIQGNSNDASVQGNIQGVPEIVNQFSKRWLEFKNKNVVNFNEVRKSELAAVVSYLAYHHENDRHGNRM
jgi:hypothetical protein